MRECHRSDGEAILWLISKMQDWAQMGLEVLLETEIFPQAWRTAMEGDPFRPTYLCLPSTFRFVLCLVQNVQFEYNQACDG